MALFVRESEGNSLSSPMRIEGPVTMGVNFPRALIWFDPTEGPRSHFPNPKTAKES